MFVENLKSPRSGRKVVNQFVIYGHSINGQRVTCFQSYDSLVAVRYVEQNKVSVNSKYVKYSRTTTRYLNMFLSEYCYGDKMEIVEGLECSV